MWALNVPQKVKNLLWRASCYAMPTEESLVRRPIINDPVCDCCHQASENPLHVLWLCTELDIVYANSVLWGFRRSTAFQDFREPLSWMITQSRNVNLFTYIVWAIWTQRNQIHLHKPAQALHQLPQLSKDRLHSFKRVWSKFIKWARSTVSHTSVHTVPHSLLRFLAIQDHTS